MAQWVGFQRQVKVDKKNTPNGGGHSEKPKPATKILALTRRLAESVDGLNNSSQSAGELWSCKTCEKSGRKSLQLFFVSTQLMVPAHCCIQSTPLF